MPRTRQRKVTDTYLRLVSEFPLRHLRSQREHREAAEMFRRLSTEMSQANADQGTRDYLDVLVDLIAAYEEKAGHRLDTSRVTAADLVRHLLTERGMSVNALAKAVDMSQGTLNDMLNGHREWSKSAITKLSDYFGLQPGIFLRPSPRTRRIA